MSVLGENVRIWMRNEGLCTIVTHNHCIQCWTEGRSSTAVAEDLRPTAMATVAEV